MSDTLETPKLDITATNQGIAQAGATVGNQVNVIMNGPVYAGPPPAAEPAHPKGHAHPAKPRLRAAAPEGAAHAPEAGVQVVQDALTGEKTITVRDATAVLTLKPTKSLDISEFGPVQKDYHFSMQSHTGLTSAVDPTYRVISGMPHDLNRGDDRTRTTEGHNPVSVAGVLGKQDLVCGSGRDAYVAPPVMDEAARGKLLDFIKEHPAIGAKLRAMDGVPVLRMGDGQYDLRAIESMGAPRYDVCQSGKPVVAVRDAKPR